VLCRGVSGWGDLLPAKPGVWEYLLSGRGRVHGSQHRELPGVSWWTGCVRVLPGNPDLLPDRLGVLQQRTVLLGSHAVLL
jgi:hypothetical protein